MKQIERNESTQAILDSIKVNNELKEYLLYPLPRPYCCDLNNLKAFVLGADPSNFSDAGATVFLETVFGIEGGDPRYFQGHLDNLAQIGLNLGNIYVQNLVRNYLTFETSKNPSIWRKFAAIWVGELKQEFDTIDPTMQIPVLITAEVIYKFLVNEGHEKHTAKDFYECKVSIPVPNEKNKLARPLIPLYRHYTYRLDRAEWQDYKSKIKAKFQS